MHKTLRYLSEHSK